MKTFEQSFADIDRLVKTEKKPLLAMYAKLGEEFGEVGEATLVREGHNTHKVLKEPLEGEIADVCQIAISMLIKANPHLSTMERMALFLSYLEKKNDKWDKVQRVDAIAKSRPSEEFAPITVAAKGTDKPSNLEDRVYMIVSEQLGYAQEEVLPQSNFTNDLGADSMDLVELTMAIEDEFDLEIPDEHAEAISTSYQIIIYLKRHFGMVIDPAEEYTKQTGRYLTLGERVQERSLHRPDGLEEL